MGARIPIPPALVGRAILSSEIPAYGLKRGRLRGADVAHPFHGVSAVNVDTDTILGRCRAYEPVLRDGQWFSHVTALELFGAPLPADMLDQPIHLVVAAPRTPPRSRGVCGHVFASNTFEVGIRIGYPVVSAADAWVQSATLLGREDLVAAADFLVTGRRVGRNREAPPATLEQLAAAAMRTRGSRGAAKVRWALPRVRIGPDSRPESLLRLLLSAARFPTPAIRHSVVVEGGLVFHPDLTFVEAQVVLEYEGDIHRTDRATWLDDIERRELVEAAGWRVVRVTSRDLFEHPELFVARLRRIMRGRTRR